MPVIVSGKNIEVGESLRQFTEQELRQIVETYMGEILEAHVIFSKDHHNFKCDIAVHISRNFVIHCHGQDEDAYRSVSLALQKLETRIKRYKTRLRNKKRHRDESMDLLTAQQYILSSTEEDKGEDSPLIIAEMDSTIPTLSVGEAVMQMDLSESPVLFFKNASNNQFNVVYKRGDGHIGWIDPNHKSK